MALFDYQATTGSGRLMKGTLEAATADAAAQMLSEMGLTVNQLQAAPRPLPKTRIGRQEFLLFNQQMATIAQAGIPLEQGLKELSADIRSAKLRKAVQEIAEELEQGASVEDAFAKRRDLFPPLYGEILRAGIESGRLGDMLSSLNHHLEISGQTRRALFEATCYPLVILTLASILITAIFLIVIPSFAGIFADMKQSLPSPTQFFLSIPPLVIPFWITVGIVILSVIVFCLLLSTFPEGRRFRQRLTLKLPFIGNLVHRSMLSRLADAMALLVGTGCDLPQSVRMAATTTGNDLIVHECDQLARRLEEGENMVEAGQFCSVIPPLFFYSAQIGAQRNELQDNLYGLSDMYDQQLSACQLRLQALLGPLLIIGVGFIIAIVVIAMFMPMISMLDSVK